MNNSMLIKRGFVLIIAIIFLATIIPASSIGISYETKKETARHNFAMKSLGEPNLEWQKHYGGDERDYGEDIIELIDEGYLIVGNYNAGSFDENIISQGWILKVGQDGNKIWDKKYGEQENWFNSIEKTSDGYIVGGTIYYDDIGEHKMYLVKIDGEGNVKWENSYGYNNSDEYQADLKVFSDGSIVLLGSTFEGGDLTNPLLIKVDKNGDEVGRIIVDRYPEDSTEDPHLKSIAFSSDGGFVCAGYIQQKDISNYDFWLIKFNTDFEKQWDRLYDTGESFDWANSVIQTTDNEYVIAGEYYYEEHGTPYTGAWVVKTDSFGNLIWDEKFEGFIKCAEAYHIEETQDKGYVIAGATDEEVLSTINNYWIMKISQSGEEVWSLGFGSYGLYEKGYCIKQTSDGGYITTGYMEIETDDNFEDHDLWLLKFSKEEYEFEPEKPQGTTSGEPNTEYTYQTSVIHPEGLKVHFYWSFESVGEVDVISDGWYESGEICTQTYSWAEQGFYTIRVKAMDEEGRESSWSDSLPVSMPKNKKILNNVLFDGSLSKIYTRHLFRLNFLFRK